jgi:hypothetical protein
MASTTRTTAADVQISGILDMNGYHITSLETDLSQFPLEDSDGASKIYVDTTVNDTVNSLLNLVDGGEF